MTGWKAVLPVLLAMAPLTVRAQSAIYTGRLSCTPTDGGTVPGGTDPITINSRSYQGTYTHRMDSAGGALAGLQDFGRGSLVGRDLTLHGGASRMGVKLETTIKASNSAAHMICKPLSDFPAGALRFRRPARAKAQPGCSSAK